MTANMKNTIARMRWTVVRNGTTAVVPRKYLRFFRKHLTATQMVSGMIAHVFLYSDSYSDLKSVEKNRCIP